MSATTFAQSPVSFLAAKTIPGWTADDTFYAAGDINADGKLDLVLVNDTDRTITVMLGNGDGTFQTKATYAVGYSPSSIAMGDFNGDTKLDLAVGKSSSSESSISVLLGNGDGSFQTAVKYPTNWTPKVVAVGDFNGDGKLDLVTPNEMLLGNGDGSFQAAVTTASRDDYWVTAADFNSDGKPDLAIGVCVHIPQGGGGYKCGDYVSVLLGKGDGTFQSAVDYKVTNANSVAAGDLDGDGRPDLVAAGTTFGTDSGSVSILFNNGNGTFQTAVQYPRPNAAGTITVADVNNDGPADVAVGGGYDSGISVLLNNGGGVFEPVWYAGAGQAVIVGDFNGDGKPDLVVQALLLLGSGDGTFQAARFYPVPGGILTGLAAADFNGDGYLDLVTPAFNGCGTNNSVAVLLGNSDGSFQPAVYYTVDTGAYAAGYGDFNGDGKLDLAVANYGGAFCGKPGGNNVSVLLGNGDGTFQARVNYGVGNTPVSLVVDDFSGDDILDVATANTNVNDISVLLGNGNGTFQSAANYTAGSEPQAIAAGDFNRDGKLDLAVPNFTSNNVSVFLGNGDGTFQAAVNYAVGAGPSSIATGDFNGDGNLDLAVVDGNNYSVSVLLGNGNGTFQAAVDYSTGSTGRPAAVAAADFNADGILDLAVNDWGYSVSILLGNGDGTFLKAADYYAGSNSIVAADFNGDGIPDLATTFDNGIAVSFNTTQSTPILSVTPPSLSFNASVGGSNPPAQAISITNTGSGTLSWTAANTQSWLVLDSSSGAAPATVHASVNIAGLTPGTYTDTVTVTASGATGSPASVAVTLTIQSGNKAATTTTLASSKRVINLPATLTLTATVTAPAGTPDGAVTFLSGTTPLGTANLNSSGIATLTLPNPSGNGKASLTAAYAGSTNYADSSSSALVQYIFPGPPTYTLTASQTRVKLHRGQSAGVTITLTPINGFDGTVTFSCGIMHGIICRFTPPQLTGNLDGTPSTTTMLIVTRGPAWALNHAWPTRRDGSGGLLAFWSLGTGALGLVVVRRAVETRRSRWLLLACVLAVTLLLLPAGCGFHPAPTAAELTPTGTQSAVISATATPTSSGTAVIDPAQPLQIEIEVLP